MAAKNQVSIPIFNPIENTMEYHVISGNKVQQMLKNLTIIECRDILTDRTFKFSPDLDVFSTNILAQRSVRRKSMFILFVCTRYEDHAKVEMHFSKKALSTESFNRLTAESIMESFDKPEERLERLNDQDNQDNKTYNTSNNTVDALLYGIPKRWKNRT